MLKVNLLKRFFINNIIMLFLIKWTVSSKNRVQCWNAFGNMTPTDDLADTGNDITIIGRWHQLGGSGGVCICKCRDSFALNSWMLNWSPICDINVEPVVDDATARASLQDKPFFESKLVGETKG
jgi:hypothetical protein